MNEKTDAGEYKTNIFAKHGTLLPPCFPLRSSLIPFPNS